MQSSLPTQDDFEAEINTVPSTSLEQDCLETIDRTLQKQIADVQLATRESMRKATLALPAFRATIKGAYQNMTDNQIRDFALNQLLETKRRLKEQQVYIIAQLKMLADYRRDQLNAFLQGSPPVQTGVAGSF